jgi:hypothetical protein
MLFFMGMLIASSEVRNLKKATEHTIQQLFDLEESISTLQQLANDFCLEHPEYKNENLSNMRNAMQIFQTLLENDRDVRVKARAVLSKGDTQELTQFNAELMDLLIQHHALVRSKWEVLREAEIAADDPDFQETKKKERYGEAIKLWNRLKAPLPTQAAITALSDQVLDGAQYRRLLTLFHSTVAKVNRLKPENTMPIDVLYSVSINLKNNFSVLHKDIIELQTIMNSIESEFRKSHSRETRKAEP